MEITLSIAQPDELPSKANTTRSLSRISFDAPGKKITFIQLSSNLLTDDLSIFLPEVLDKAAGAKEARRLDCYFRG